MTRWLLAGGGTAGHVNPLLAVADQLVREGDEALVLGTAEAEVTHLDGRAVGLPAVTRVFGDLRRHQDAQSRGSGRAPRVAADPTAGERLKDLRRELNGLVAAWHHRTGSPHGVIHADLRSACGGPPTAVASAGDLEQRIATIRSWAVHRRS